jgi:hypothetical protein
LGKTDRTFCSKVKIKQTNFASATPVRGRYGAEEECQKIVISGVPCGGYKSYAAAGISNAGFTHCKIKLKNNSLAQLVSPVRLVLINLTPTFYNTQSFYKPSRNPEKILTTLLIKPRKNALRYSSAWQLIMM